VFRGRGYSHEALSLRSSNLGNDVLVIFIIMAIGSVVDLLAGGFLKLSPTQMLLGAPLTFFTHVLETGLPIMVFIYAILFPRYLKLSGSPVTAQFGPPGMMKAFLTLRTGNAWVHLWAYHAVTPHVTNDTPMVVEIFHIR